MIDPEVPDRDCPHEVGEIVHINRASSNNDVGGTLMLGDREFDVEIVRSFWDYETGWRFWGRLLDADDVETVKQLGVTGLNHPYRKDLRGLPGFENKDPDFWIYDPARVYFSEFDIAPIPTPTP